MSESLNAGATASLALNLERSEWTVLPLGRTPGEHFYRSDPPDMFKEKSKTAFLAITTVYWFNPTIRHWMFVQGEGRNSAGQRHGEHEEDWKTLNAVSKRRKDIIMQLIQYPAWRSDGCHESYCGSTSAEAQSLAEGLEAADLVVHYIVGKPNEAKNKTQTWIAVTEIAGAQGRPSRCCYWCCNQLSKNGIICNGITPEDVLAGGVQQSSHPLSPLTLTLMQRTYGSKNLERQRLADAIDTSALMLEHTIAHECGIHRSASQSTTTAAASSSSSSTSVAAAAAATPLRFPQQGALPRPWQPQPDNKLYHPLQ